MLSRKSNIIFTLIALIVFLVMGIMVRNSSEGILFDLALLEFIHSSKSPLLLGLMKFISFIGSGYFLFPVLGVAIIYMLIKRKYYLSKLLMASSLGSWIVNFILKMIFNRTRPLDFFLVEQGGLSYPSGHSMVSMSMFLTISYLLSRTEKFKDKKKLIYSIVIFYVLLMGISRMYLGVHWPTDIIGGFIMGYIFFQIVIATINK